MNTSSEVAQRFLTAPEAAFADVQAHYLQNHYAYQSIVSQQLPRYLLTGGYPQAALAANSEQAFLRLKEIWSPIQVYSTNKISTIKKRPKAYFNDLGMRNYLASTFDRTQLEKEKGAIAENFVYLHLLRLQQYRLRGMAKLAFWRSPDGNEVDFVLESGANVLPIEVKFQKSGQVKMQRGFHIFLRKLQLEQAVVVSNSTPDERRTSECRIFIIPLVLFGMV